MTEDNEKLCEILERATAPGTGLDDDLDPETKALRESWLRFGQLLETLPSLPVTLGEGQAYKSPLPLGEGQGVRAVPRSTRTRRRLLSTAALAAASLLIGILSVWTPDAMQKKSVTIEQQSAAIKTDDATLVHQNQPAAPKADELRWDDALDEQIELVGQQVTNAQQGSGDAIALLQYGIERVQEDLDANKL
jgi:hypothetical protein